MDNNIKYMKRCLQLAKCGEYYTAPNPMVGAVLVYDGKIIGEGFHQQHGGAHAEPNAIYSVKDPSLLEKSTLYVNLEPCSHYGKTPPCADLIVSKKIPRVVIGSLDPNPKVAGKGIEILTNAGVEVIVGVLENECRVLNKRFFTYFLQKRPYVFLKWAQTHDAFIDKKRQSVENGKALLISNKVTAQLTHKMRAENQAMMVGTQTIVLDNPNLTLRNWRGRNPVRIAIDRNLRINEEFNIFDGKTPTIIFTEKEHKSNKNVEYVKIDFNEKLIENILSVCYQKNIQSILVEGGTQLLNAFITSGLWDEANVEVGKISIGSGVKAPDFSVMPDIIKTFDGNKWFHYKNERNQSIFTKNIEDSPNV
jgi:diaminohydroxyphosphoribosylaminopyrimidine deaminase/5-amino-6-(5-phosphoribosylamino)uracil reductase